MVFLMVFVSLLLLFLDAVLVVIVEARKHLIDSISYTVTVPNRTPFFFFLVWEMMFVDSARTTARTFIMPCVSSWHCGRSCYYIR